MKNLEIKTSKKGVIADLLNDLITTLILISLVAGEVLYLQFLKGAYAYSSIFELAKLENVEVYEFFILFIWTIFSVIIIFCLVFSVIPYHIYGWKLALKTINKIEGNRITKIEHSLLCGKTDSTYICHQILKIEASQSLFEITYNTGSITIYGISKTNTTSEDFEIKIENIDDPQKVKEEIISMFPDYSPIQIVKQ